MAHLRVASQNKLEAIENIIDGSTCSPIGSSLKFRIFGFMETVVINVKKQGNAKFILELAKRLGETGKILSKADQEDFLLGHIIETEKTGKIDSRETVFKRFKP